MVNLIGDATHKGPHKPVAPCKRGAGSGNIVKSPDRERQEKVGLIDVSEGSLTSGLGGIRESRPVPRPLAGDGDAFVEVEVYKALELVYGFLVWERREFSHLA